jgi:hypothetical protein
MFDDYLAREAERNGQMKTRLQTIQRVVFLVVATLSDLWNVISGDAQFIGENIILCKYVAISSS